MTFRRQMIGSLAAAAILAPALVHADAPAPKWYDKVAVGGYTDAYYKLDLNRPADGGTVTGGGAFDTTRNQFAVEGAELTLKTSDDASKTSYFVDLLLGSKAGIYNANSTASSQILGQAYVTQAFGNANFTLGKFATPIGTEVAYTPSNANFSRGLLYGNEPYYNLGLKLDYTLPASFVLSGWVDNGSSVDAPISSGKGYGAMLAFSGIKNLSLTGIYYLQPLTLLNGGQLLNMSTGDFLASYTLNDSLSFSGEYLYETAIVSSIITGAGNPKNMGYALYATYNTPVANLSVSPRFEQWFSPDLYSVAAVAASANQQLNDFTLTLKYAKGPLTHILEYRLDSSSNPAYATTGNGGNASTGTQTNQYYGETLTYAATYSF